MPKPSDHRRRRSTWKGLWELLRPRLLPSAVCDVFAGFALAGGSLWAPPITLFFNLLGSLFLYAMGMVFNDVAGLREDKAMGRKKPLVRGDALQKDALVLGLGLLVLGNLSLFLGDIPAIFGGILTLCILLYDFGSAGFLWPKLIWNKMAPLFLGLCRGMNLSLGYFLIKGQLGAWPIPLLILGAYCLYTLLVGIHGRLEDLGAKANPLASKGIAVIALSLLLLAPIPLTLPWSGVLILPSLLGVLKSRTVPSRTGILLKGFARFGTILALASKAYAIAGICAVPGWILPLFVRKRWS